MHVQETRNASLGGRLSRRTRAAVLAAAAAMIAGSASAAMANTIAITNANFETAPANNYGTYGFPLPGWTNYDGSGATNTTGADGVITPTYSPAPQQGTLSAYIDDSIGQSIGTLAAGQTYVFNYYQDADFANSGTNSSTVGIELLDTTTGNSTTLTSTVTNTPSSAPWVPFSETFTPIATASLGSNGDPLSLEFIRVSGGQVFLDSVSGTVTPEPASLGILALGAAGLLGRRPKRR